MAAGTSERLIRKLTALNPDITVIRGKRHWKVIKNRRLVAILPFTPAKEGLAENTKRQFRRVGIILP